MKSASLSTRSSIIFFGNLTEERARRLTGSVDMVDVSEDKRIRNAPQLPKHPLYKSNVEG
ncbi:unnamed protein product [Albugo candida]|uniref:Uncharacterized protein n=1 Tax=Albugo candida TaxID=65357 RepID=A0A024GBQ4_9STRA|nr:unnamed protein product [Albugo candida]|eukprot:CCI44292.1 unnamed protein product [Albugo candida]